MLKSEFLEYIDTKVGEIPTWVIRPKEKNDKYKTIIFYHGWGSCRNNQVFRAAIFASYGYQVILPEARYHGERGSLDYEKDEVKRDYFLRVLMHNIEESVSIYKAAIEEFNADEKNIYVSGHSLGAITAGSIYTFNKKIKAALLFNGSMNWQKIVEDIKSLEDEKDWTLDRRYEFSLQMDPMIHIEDMENRPLFMIHGEEDDVVNPEYDREFYKVAKDSFDEGRIIFETFEKTTHQITTHMLERGINLLKEIE